MKTKRFFYFALLIFTYKLCIAGVGSTFEEGKLEIITDSRKEPFKYDSVLNKTSSPFLFNGKLHRLHVVGTEWVGPYFGSQWGLNKHAFFSLHEARLEYYPSFSILLNEKNIETFNISITIIEISDKRFGLSKAKEKQDQISGIYTQSSIPGHQIILQIYFRKFNVILEKLGERDKSWEAVSVIGSGISLKNTSVWYKIKVE